MAAVSNRAKGELIAWARSALTGSGFFRALILSISEDESTLQDYATVAAVIAAAGNDESTAAGYGRKSVSGLAVSTDNVLNRQTLSFDPITFSGITSGSIACLVLYYDPTGSSADSACRPVAFFSQDGLSFSGSPVRFRCPAGGAVVAP
jgi:hypothetical protein